MAGTLFDRIWDAHRVAMAPSGAELIAIDRVFLHERTGAAALARLAEQGRALHDPARVFAVMDHIVDTRPGRGTGGMGATLMPGGQAFITETRAACRAAGITLFDVTDREQGIVHVISPELGVVLPGLTLVAPDSHTCTQGAFGALAWGIGSSEAEHAMATGTLRMSRPKAMRVAFSGTSAKGVTAKDMALHLIAAHGADGGAGHAIEFAGAAVDALDMEARMTLCQHGDRIRRDERLCRARREGLSPGSPDGAMHPPRSMSLTGKPCAATRMPSSMPRSPSRQARSRRW